MRFLYGYISLYFSLVGLKRYWQKKFIESISMYEKACRYASKEKDKIYYFSFIGRSNFFLDNYIEAEKYLLPVYEYFKNNNFIVKDGYEKDAMRESIKALYNTLKMVNKKDRLKEIAEDIDAIEIGTKK